jgi:hypothetical protein
MKNWLILFSIIGLFLLNACNDYRNLPELQVLDFVVDDCHTQLVDGRFVITTDSMYEAVMENFINPDSACVGSTLTNFDFLNYSLLAYRKCGSGCETNFNKTLYQDDVNEKYILDIQVKEIGNCEPWRCSMNWLLVPALPDGYFVEFL